MVSEKELGECFKGNEGFGGGSVGQKGKARERKGKRRVSDCVCVCVREVGGGGDGYLQPFCGRASTAVSCGSGRTSQNLVYNLYMKNKVQFVQRTTVMKNVTA